MNRDYAHPSNLSLDTLQAHEIESYRTGAWLPSAELTGTARPSDATLMAELSARLLLAAEDLSEAGAA